jgi:hypothetical protein
MALKKFCEFSGKNPHELIKIRDDEIRSSDPNSRTFMPLKLLTLGWSRKKYENSFVKWMEKRQHWLEQARTPKDKCYRGFRQNKHQQPNQSLIP